MGKLDKEDTGFGFKDREKAVETLRLLMNYDSNYQRLTVRGLLGRAKRVLSLTKSEDKLKNIREAMEVFEEWLGNNVGQGKDKMAQGRVGKTCDTTTESTEAADTKPDTVPGLGFKDRATAEASLRELEGRDGDYQKLAVKGLLSRAKRVLTCTRDETKLSNIREAIAVFDEFLENFDSNENYKYNFPYISLGIVKSCRDIAGKRKLCSAQQQAFITAYESANGDYRRLRTVSDDASGKTWDIVRNSALKALMEQNPKPQLFDDMDSTTDEHLQLLLWAYSPDTPLVKKLIPLADDCGQENNRKRRSSPYEHERAKARKI